MSPDVPVRALLPAARPARARRLRRGRRRRRSDKQRRPWSARRGDDPQAAQGLGFPGFATKNTTRVGGADPVADAAGVAQASTPRARATRARRPSRSSTRKDWRAAISAAQLMGRPLRAPVLLSDGDELPDATQPRSTSSTRRAPTKAGERAGHPRRRRADAGGPASHRRRGRRLRRARRGDRPPPHRGRGRAERAPWWSRRRARPSSRCPPRPGRRSPATRCCGPSATRSPPATKAAITRAPAPAHLRARAGVGDLRAVRQAARRARRRRAASPAPTRSPTRSRSRASTTGASAGTSVDPGHGLVFASTERPADAAAAAALLSAPAPTARCCW